MASSSSAGEEARPTRIMIGVNESSIRGYPHPSISSRTAFDWTLQKIVRSNAAGFKLLFLHVQIPDEDGFDDMDSIYASPDDFQSMHQKEKIRGIHLLQYFVEHSHQLGIQCEAWIRKGDPKEVICQEVKKVQPDILVVGSRGLGPFQSLEAYVVQGLAHMLSLWVGLERHVANLGLVVCNAARHNRTPEAHARSNQPMLTSNPLSSPLWWTSAMHMIQLGFYVLIQS
ncbi:unnamed protein product [Musa banksii]